MANHQHLDLLKRSIKDWNDWRQQHPEIQPDLSDAELQETKLVTTRGEANLSTDPFSSLEAYGADLSHANLYRASLDGANLFNINLSSANLSGANLHGANLSNANLHGANLSNANLYGANLRDTNLRDTHLYRTDFYYADLRYADLSRADLSETNLSGQDLSNKNLSGTDLNGANLSGANLSGQDLSNKNLSGTDLSGANLSRTLLIGTNFTEATLTDCIIYGIAAWNVQLENAIQKNFIITPEGEAIITVDNLKVAQFIYLMLNNKEIRDVIDTLTTKSVLILGRFRLERKAILDALRDKLREYNYLPILFDFNRPSSQTVRETVRTLAQLSYFIIADLTEPSSIAEELEIIIPNLVVPVKPLFELSQENEFSMFKGYGVYDWVLPIYRYRDVSDLLSNLQEQVIEPARHKALIWTEKKLQIEEGKLL